MSLPIVIIFERYWDITSKLLVRDLLPDLNKKGYGTLCFEAPQDLSSSQIIERHRIGLEQDDEIQKIAKKFLNEGHITRQLNGVNFRDMVLSDLSFNHLATLLKLFVSSEKYTYLTERIKQLPASHLFKEVLEETSRFSMSIQGIDIDSEKFDQMVSLDLSKKMSAVKINENQRIATQFKNLLKLRSQKDEGIVFICGALHAEGLLTEFKKHNMHDEVLYYFPHSSRRYDDSIDDINSLAMNDTLKGHTHLLSEQDIKPFGEKIIQEIAGKIKYQMDVLEGNSHSQFLSHRFNAHFKSFIRPGYHVDALLDHEETSDYENIRECIINAGIQAHDVFMKERRFLIVPNVNDSIIAKKMRKELGNP